MCKSTGFFPVARREIISTWARSVRCGFELISEALLLGTHILATPLHGQREQESAKFSLAADRRRRSPAISSWSITCVGPATETNPQQFDANRIFD
jgi:hypothetical protein